MRIYEKWIHEIINELISHEKEFPAFILYFHEYVNKVFHDIEVI